MSENLEAKNSNSVQQRSAVVHTRATSGGNYLI